MSIPLYLFSKKHILVAAQAAREHPAIAGVDCLAEFVGAVAVVNILERLLGYVSQNVIGVVGAEMNIAVIIYI